MFIILDVRELFLDNLCDFLISVQITFFTKNNCICVRKSFNFWSKQAAIASEEKRLNYPVLYYDLCMSDKSENTFCNAVLTSSVSSYNS